jgi:hypothetical protein
MTRREITTLALSVLGGFLTGYALLDGPLWLAITGTIIVATTYAIVFLAPTWLKGQHPHPTPNLMSLTTTDCRKWTVLSHDTIVFQGNLHACLRYVRQHGQLQTIEEHGAIA